MINITKIMGIIVAFSILGLNIFFNWGIPDKYEQEKMFLKEINSLHMVEFKQSKETFVRERTYVVEYRYINDIDITKTRSYLVKKFRENDWLLKKETNEEGMEQIQFIKEGYICYINFYDDMFELVFRINK